jgi:serine/threonine protein kinase
MAPELTKTCTPNKKVDIYSFGITINSYFAMREPYYNMEAINPFMLMERIYNGQRPEIAHCMEQELVDLVIQCWSPTSEQRPSINEILQILKSYGT